MTAVFGFAVWFTSSRPIVVDEHVAFATVAAEDSPAGLLDARQTAIAMVLGAHPSEMPTRTELLHVEL